MLLTKLEISQGIIKSESVISDGVTLISFSTRATPFILRLRLRTTG